MTAIQVNLLPKGYVQKCRRSQRLRLWCLAAVAAVGFELLLAGGLRPLGQEVRQMKQEIQQAKLQRQTLNEKLKQLSTGQGDLDRKLMLADRLNRKHTWSDLLAELARRMPPTVVLTQVESMPAQAKVVQNQERKTEPVAGTGGNAEQDSDVATGLLISGVATDHESVADLLRNLNRDTRLGRCELGSTLRQPFMNGEGVSFTIRTQW